MAIATKLGTGLSTPAINTVLVGGGAGTSSWTSISLASPAVVNTLPVSKGGTGTTTSTGTGDVVLGTSPTIATPAISNPTISGTISGGPTITAPTISSPTITGNASISGNLTVGGSNQDAGIALSTYRDEDQFDFVASGLVITADSAGATKNWSMTAGVVHINGQRLVVGALSAQVATASKDTYIDILNTAGVASVVMTGGNIVNNNAASPTLAANSLRIGIIITGAASIADAGSINQGEVGKILPIASSIAYEVTDSLGNLICNRSPSPTLLGYRQILADQTTITTQVDVTGLSVSVIVPTNRKIAIDVRGGGINGTANADFVVYMMEGATQLTFEQFTLVTANRQQGINPSVILSPTAGLHTYKLQAAAGSGSATFKASSINPAFIAVYLI